MARKVSVKLWGHVSGKVKFVLICHSPFPDCRAVVQNEGFSVPNESNL